MRIQQNVKLDFSDVLIVPQRSDLVSRSDVDLTRKFHFSHSGRSWSGIPIIAANMSAVGTFEMARVFHKHKMLVALHKHYTVDELVNFFNEEPFDMRESVFYTVGIDYKTEIEKITSISERLKESKYDWPLMLNCDVPNGYITPFVEAIRAYRKAFPEAIILAGNVVTPNMTEELIINGADIVKVGIGSGSVCQTRIKAGVGYPQLSAVDDCSFAAHGKPNGHICSDGGCSTSGDVAKAFAAGSDFVMLGGMFAGTDECFGKWSEDRKTFKFFGMSSKDAQEQFNGGLKHYRASEGRTAEIPAKGPVVGVIHDILGGLRSTCTYVGASSIKNLPKCAEFIRVNRVHTSA